MKKLALVALVFLSFFLKAQKADDKINNGSINKKYLEHLIKIGIDSVRQAHGLKTLVNDSILYVAANHHAQYLLTGTFAHEENIKKFETPQIRAEYYGATKDYLVGENIIMSYHNFLVRSKKSKESNYIDSYQEMAWDLVKGWVNSKGHFANMLTPNYNITGLAIAINEKTNAVYAVQKFAHVLNKYEFKENAEFFSYSNYIVPKPITSFNGIEQKLHAQKHEWDLKTLDTNSLTYIIAQNEINNNYAPLKWEINGDNIYLVAEYNAESFANYFTSSKDGIAVEIVNYTPFDCGNPAYYTDQSRRNKQCEFSGIVLKPIYKKDVLMAFKPRQKKAIKRMKEEIKKNKNDGFFKKVIKGYTQPYTPTSFRLKMGKIPKDALGYMEFNLVYIKDGGVARVSHFSQFCGDYYTEFYPMNYILDLPESNYVPIPYEKEYQFEFQFKQGQSDYSYKDLKPLMDSLTGDAFLILNADITAFSSVEGSEKINKTLQEKRAGNLVKALQENQDYKIKANVKTATNWLAFQQQIDTTKALMHLKDLTKNQLLDSLNDEHFATRYEPYLAKQRKAKIVIKTRFDLNDKTVGLFLQKEHSRLYNKLNEKTKDSLYFRIIDTLELIQKYAYQKVQEGILQPAYLLSFPCCGKEETHKLYNNMFCFEEEFHLKHLVEPQSLQKYLTNQNYDIAGANYLIYIMKNWDSTSAPKGIGMEDLQKGVENFYTNDSLLIPLLPKLGLNYSFKAVEYYYRQKNYAEMLKNLYYIFSYYMEHKPDENTAVKIAKCFTRYHSIAFAEGLLNSYVLAGSKNPDLLAYYAIVGYYNSIEMKKEDYAKWLINIYPNFAGIEWCKIFVGECKVSFQVLDSELFRNFYCEKCGDYRNAAKAHKLWDNK